MTDKQVITKISSPISFQGDIRGVDAKSDSEVMKNNQTSDKSRVRRNSFHMYLEDLLQ
jgi:hypothetical protein